MSRITETSLPIKQLAEALNKGTTDHASLAERFRSMHLNCQAWRKDLEEKPSATCAHLRDALLEIECAYLAAAELFETLPKSHLP